MLKQLEWLNFLKTFNVWNYGLIAIGIIAVFFGGVFVLIKFTGKG
jgi:hypothetical protein